MSTDVKRSFTAGQKLKFIVPSLVGLLLFVVPLPWGGGDFTIGVGYMASAFKAAYGSFLPAFMVGVVGVSALLATLCTVLKPKAVMASTFLKNLLVLSPMGLAVRLVSAFFGAVIIGGVDAMGLDKISSAVTGGVVVNDLFPVLATWFFFSGFFLPLLMAFGSMDYLGTLIRKFMRPLFKVPGRSAIDAIASWIGSGPVGVVITDKQYREGYYTTKEASIIAVCFSLVSLPFAVFIHEFLKLTTSFLAFYGAISLASFTAALILPRLYPLSRKPERYKDGVEVKINEVVPEGRTTHSWAFERGVLRASEAPGVKGLILSGLQTVVDVYFSLMPIVLLLGTLSLIVAEYTPVFQWISRPLVPVFQWLQVPEASVAASAALVGFADMFLPSIFVQGAQHEMTRFVIGALSFTQLIYMTETGAIILRSKIPLSLPELLLIFVERTLITLPIVVWIAHWVY